MVVFVLFAWILGKFAWGPLLKIVDEREKTIREQVDSAQLAAAEAKDLLAQHQEMLQGRGPRARGDPQEGGQGGRAGARRSRRPRRGPRPSRPWLAPSEQIGREKDQAIAELRAEVADIAVEAASRIVKSSLTEEAQRKLVDDYIRELPRAQKEGRA